MKYAYRGVALTEYGLVFASVAVLCIMALSLLGGSISDLLGEGVAGELARSVGINGGQNGGGNNGGQNGGGGNNGGSVRDNMTPGSVHDGTVALEGSGYMVWRKNPDTGELEMVITDGSGHQDVNATSVDGTKWNALGSMMLAKELEAIAEQYPEGSPQHDWFYQLANFGLFNAGTQGYLNNEEITAMTRTEETNAGRAEYSYGDAVRDLLRYQGQIKWMLENAPPEVVASADFATARMFASDLYNISQSQIQRSIGQYAPTAEPDEEGARSAVAFDQLVHRDLLASDARGILAGHGLENISVELAVTDAVGMDEIAQGGGGG